MYRFVKVFKIQIRPLRKLFLRGCFRIQGLGAIQRTSKCFHDPAPFKAQHAHSVSTSDARVPGLLPANAGATREVTSAQSTPADVPADTLPWNLRRFANLASVVWLLISSKTLNAESLCELTEQVPINCGDFSRSHWNNGVFSQQYLFVDHVKQLRTVDAAAYCMSHAVPIHRAVEVQACIAVKAQVLRSPPKAMFCPCSCGSVFGLDTVTGRNPTEALNNVEWLQLAFIAGSVTCWLCDCSRVKAPAGAAAPNVRHSSRLPPHEPFVLGSGRSPLPQSCRALNGCQACVQQCVIYEYTSDGNIHSGMSIFSLVFIVALFWLRFQIWNRLRSM